MIKKKKLTLSLPDETIRRAKRYARHHRTSISAVVTQFFNAIKEEQKRSMPVEDRKLAVVTESSRGLISLPPKKKADLITEALKQKYSRK